MKTQHKKIGAKTLGIIPARLDSKRLPGKLLADICGKPLIQYTFEQAKKSKLLDDLVIATDSREISRVARSFGAHVIITSKKHKTGSDRLGEAVQKYRKFKPDIVVNIQGDEPIISPGAIDKTIKTLTGDHSLSVSGVLARTTKENEVLPSSVVQAVLDKNGFVLYFSRAVVPFAHNGAAKRTFYRILGLTAFRRDFLFKYVSLPQLYLERTEGIEQMRIIEHGYKMKMVVGNFEEMGVNTQEELERVRKIIGKKLNLL